ncbi:hypothetical protein CPC08DRAFT_466596 [Agrocybe pediades]|nr:hypothetical protein CPC08DRAFT_466596 [Agrocybe pediades]
MMRSGIPLRSTSSSTPHSSSTAQTRNQAGPASQIPSIRLISATPSSTGVSASASGSEASTSFVFNRSLEEEWAALAPTVGLAPKEDQSQEPRRKLVPKKSKLSLLSIGMGKGRDQKREERARDLSDVVRRVGVNPTSGSFTQQGFGHGGGPGSGAFEIYVDPSVDPDIGDIVVVKKKKSRLGLDGMAWSAAGSNGAVSEVTNVPKTRQEEKEKDGLLKVKIDEGQKWWSIGRGRKDSKEEKKDKKKDKENFKISHKPIEYIHQPDPPRSKTPEPFKPSQENQGRGRFNSLDSGFLLRRKTATKEPSPAPSLRGDAYDYRQYLPGPASIVPMPMDDDDHDQDKRSTNSTPGLLSVPGAQTQAQGSIALRAMRSVKSLARMGSWAQLNDTGNASNKEKSGDEKKEKKTKKTKAKGKAEEEEKEGKKKSIKKKSTKSKKDKEEKAKADTIRQSSSSFEIGALTASPGPPTPATPGFETSVHGNASTLGVKNRKSASLLGLGLPSTMRLPSVRIGSSASSVYNINVAPPTADPTNSANRLSVESAVPSATPRPSSIMSSGSSLRPLSAASTNSGSRLSVVSNGAASKRSSSASVRWDEEGLETVKEQRRKERESIDSQLRRKEREEKRASRESRRSSEGRRRTPLTSIFPEVRKSLEEVEIGKRMLEGEEEEVEEEEPRYPILTIEEATADGHGLPADWDEPLEDDDSGKGEDIEDEECAKPAATPVKKARARPLSEQLLGRTRPKPMYEDDEGVLSILDAATNDLAQLINVLDLQATPTTPDLTPLRPSPGSVFYSHSPTPVSTLEKVKPSEYDGSPRRRKMLQPESPLTAKKASATMGPSAGDLFRQMSTSSISSLRPYAQCRGYPPKSSTSNAASASNAAKAVDVQPVAHWTTLMKSLSPVKEKSFVAQPTSTSPSNSSPLALSAFGRAHKRTLTPGPEPEPEVALPALRPAPIMRSKSKVLTQSTSSAQSNVAAPDQERGFSGSLTPVFTRMNEDGDHQRRSISPSARLTPNMSFSPRSSVCSRASRASHSSKGSESSYGSRIHPLLRAGIREEEDMIPGGTFGGSDISAYGRSSDVEIDASDPDSDVPDELRYILAGSSDRGSVVGELDNHDVADDTGHREEVEFGHSELPTSLALELPPFPTFQASLVDTDNKEHQLDLADIPSSPSENDTNKSFDFTGELQKLNSSGASDRRSFVEQLENAFRTPAKVDLRYALDLGDIPPVPTLNLAKYEDANTTEDLTGDSDLTGRSGDSGTGFEYGLVPESVSQLVDMNLPGLSMMDRTEEKTRSPDNAESKSNSDLDFIFPSRSESQLVQVKEPTNINNSSDFDDGNVSRTSEGELNTSFRFGGLPRDDAASFKSNRSKENDKPMTLSDIIPSPAHARALSIASSRNIHGDIDSYLLDGLDDDSVLESIYAQIMTVQGAKRDEKVKPQDESEVEQGRAQARQRPTRQEQRENRRSIYKAVSRPASGISFEGFSSFDEVRRGFEFSNNRPAFYPPPGANQSASIAISDFSFSFFGSNASANASNGQGRRVVPHRRHESAMSFASVSSYGHVVLNPGSHDPFDYAQLPSLRERPSSEDMSSCSSAMGLSTTVDDTFAYRANQPRRRVDSDASSFYFKAPVRGHKRRESNMSVSSLAPPISMYNRSFGHHRRNDSSASTSSVAMSYIKHGANGGISAWSRHRRMESNMSADSLMSEFSAMRLGRPGIGDKMFDNVSADGLPQPPLTAISASPRSDQEDFTSSSMDFQQDRLSSASHVYPYDSIIDAYDEQHKSSMEDSLFEKTGYQRTSVMSDSVFGDNDADDLERYYRGNQGGFFARNQYRPLSILSRNSVHSPPKEDDTMISMLGGGHVRRQSVGSIIEASPCVRVEKRKHSAVLHGLRLVNGKDTDYNNVESPSKARIVEKPSIASTSSLHFGGDRMIKAQRGLLERQSLEESCLIADGEEMALASAAIHSMTRPVFTRPSPGRSRSSTCTSSSSGGDTPPLSVASDVSSVSGGSQSSIDLSQINIALSNATYPSASGHTRTTGVGPRTRARAPGTGHRRRYSKAHMSRTSVYETIEEERVSSASSESAQSSPSNSVSFPASATKKLNNGLESNKEDSPTTRQSIYIVDSDTASLGAIQNDDGNDYTTSTWDDERGIVALRKFYALKDEAHVTVTESRRIWKDTAFSTFAIQSFQAPGSPAGMQALLQHSVQNYGPLPSELRPHRVRSRTNSRASPYPKSSIQSRLSRISLSPEQVTQPQVPTITQKTPGRALQDVTINPNTAPKTSNKAAAPSLDALKPFSPLAFDVDVNADLKAAQAAVNVRPRVGSNARRTALGWSKRSTGPSATNAAGTGKKSSTGHKENKENVIIAATGAGSIMTPGETLRLNRPRPRGRPTPGGRTPAAVRPLRI